MIVLITVLLLGIRWLVQEVESRLEPKPRAIPAGLSSPSEYVALKERLNRFADAVREGKVETPLVLTSPELTSLMVSYPGYEFLEKRLGTEVQSDGFHLIGSIAAAEVAPALFSRGYLNMDALFTLQVTDGRIVSDLKSLTINGQAIPAAEMEKLKLKSATQDFSEGFDSDKIPEIKSIVGYVDHVETQPDKLLVYPKRSASQSQQAAPH